VTLTLLFRLTIALVTLASVGRAQERGLDPDARRLTPGVDSLAVFLVRGADTTRTGSLRDEIRMVRVGGRDLVQRVYVSADRVLGARIDTLVDVAASLQPVRHRSRSARTVEAIDFTAGRATGWMRLANQDSLSVDAAAAGAYNASSFDLVLRASSLRASWEASVPVFLPTTRTVVPLHARVTGTETIDGELCWRVQAEFTGTPVTFWIGQTSRRLRQQVMQARPDLQILFRPALASAHSSRAT
jgi:hypothetical protein